jgi:ABC-type transport system substrate-binding protein
MDSQIEAARFETDPAKYDAEVKSFITTAFEDVPRIPLVNDFRDVAMQKNIEGYTYWFHHIARGQINRGRTLAGFGSSRSHVVAGRLHLPGGG